MGTGELRRIHSRVVCMFLPVDKSMTVSEPHLMAHRIFSTSSSIEEATAELPMLAFILTRKFRPIAIGSDSGWFTFAGMMARPRHHPGERKPPRVRADGNRPKLPRQDKRQHRQLGRRLLNRGG